MKKNMKKRLSLIMVILLGFLSFPVQAADISNDSEGIKFLRYEYSRNVSDEVWANMTYPEKIAEYAISDSILDQMTTEQIVQAVMDYPFLVDLTLFNTFEEGYNHVVECCDALQELEQRPDGFIKLIEYYNDMPVPLSENSTDTEIIELLFAEILISNMAKKSNITGEQLADFVDIIEAKQEEMSKNPEIYGSIPSLEVVNTYSVNASYTTHTVTTLKGKNVTVIHYLSDFTTAEKNADIAYSNAYPNSTILGTTTRNYNCASYAMINRSTSNIYWLNDLSPTNAGYTRLGFGLGYAAVGRIIYYANSESPGSHVGYVHSNYNGNLTVRSKMGFGPLVQHNYQDCPYYNADTDLIFYN